VDLNGARAAVRAGYSPKSAKVQASRLLTNANVKCEVARIQGETSLRLEISRDDVIIGLLGAIELARDQGDPSTMIRGAAEISRMLGFYTQKATNKGKGGGVAECYQKQLKDMSDKELISLLAESDIGRRKIAVANYVAN
jgi:phage terminase small subunit